MAQFLFVSTNPTFLLLLFQFLLKISVFDSNPKLNSKMAKAISLLTGWDIDKTRQLFSQPVNEINPGKVKKVVKILLAELEKDSN